MRYLSKDERREEILQAAMRVALTEGFAAMTVRRIATEAGVATGQVHHHFASAGELKSLATHYTGRPSPLYPAPRITEHFRKLAPEGGELLFQRFDLQFAGLCRQLRGDLDPLCLGESGTRTILGHLSRKAGGGDLLQQAVILAGQLAEPGGQLELFGKNLLRAALFTVHLCPHSPRPRRGRCNLPAPSTAF